MRRKTIFFCVFVRRSISRGLDEREGVLDNNLEQQQSGERAIIHNGEATIRHMTKSKGDEAKVGGSLEKNFGEPLGSDG